MEPPPASPAASRAGARVRWGLPDVAIAWGAGFVAALFATPLAKSDVSVTQQPIRYVIASALFQNLGVVGALVVISRRKGRGTLAQDFGLVWPFDRLQARAVAGWLGAGALLSIVATLILLPINQVANLDEPAQDVSKILDRSSGAGRLVFALVIVLVAPVVEELLFRGALLRALQRRWSAATAIFVSSALFAAIHLLGGLGNGYVLPGLLFLGLISGYLAVKHGDLARSVLLHMGFNLLTAIALVVS